MKYLPNVILIALISILFFLIFCMYQQEKYGTLESYFNSQKSDCEVTLPQNLRVVYNGNNKKYAIEITNVWGKQFLWGRYRGWIDESFAVYTDFNDSCVAKSFAVQYIKEQNEYNKKATDYK